MSMKEIIADLEARHVADRPHVSDDLLEYLRALEDALRAKTGEHYPHCSRAKVCCCGHPMHEGRVCREVVSSCRCDGHDPDGIKDVNPGHRGIPRTNDDGGRRGNIHVPPRGPEPGDDAEQVDCWCGKPAQTTDGSLQWVCHEHRETEHLKPEILALLRARAESSDDAEPKAIKLLECGVHKDLIDDAEERGYQRGLAARDADIARLHAELHANTSGHIHSVDWETRCKRATAEIERLRSSLAAAALYAPEGKG